MSTQERYVVLVDVNRMDGGQVGAKNPLAFEQLGGRASFDRLAFLSLSGLLSKMCVKGSAPPARPGRDHTHRRGVDRADAVDRRCDSNAVAILEVVDALRPLLRVAIGEKLLVRVELPAVEATAQIAGVN